MDVKKLQEKLNTFFLGKRIDYYETIDSTHLLAKRLEIEKIEDGMIIFADSQTAGIGTHERKWFTGEGENLSFDMVFTPNCNLRNISNLTLMLAKCAQRVLNELYNIETSIKMPNDIILNDKKLAGIITESIAVGDNVKKLCIGVGLNVNQIDFPGTLVEKATSLRKEFGKEFDRMEIFIRFLEIFEQEYIKMVNRG